MKRNQRFLLAVLLVLIGGAFGIRLAQKNIIKTPSVDRNLLSASNEMNKRCPVFIDKDTRLDSTVAGPGKRLMYNYTLINFTAEQIQIQQFLSVLTPQIMNNVRTNPDMKEYRRHKITLVYSYKDKDGKFITRIEVKPTDYKGYR
jgi:hypothetical protein